MTRLFVALEPSPAFRNALSLLQERLRAEGVTGRWLHPSNLHLTLAFIGAGPEDVTEHLPETGLFNEQGNDQHRHKRRRR